MSWKTALPSSGTMSFAKAAEVLGCHTATVFRYSTRGINGVKLESWLIGGKRVTTPEAIDGFVRAINGGASAKNQSPSESVSVMVKNSLASAKDD